MPEEPPVPEFPPSPVPGVVLSAWNTVTVTVAVPDFVLSMVEVTVTVREAAGLLTRKGLIQPAGVLP